MSVSQLKIQNSKFKIQVFILVWFGQIISSIGSGLTGFALDIWVYQRTGSVTQFAIACLFSFLPSILVSPLAGALVDRYDRRKCMIFSDCGASLSILSVALLLYAGHLEIWHIYIATAIGSVFRAFQSTAYSAAMTVVIPKQYLARANGMIQLGDALTMLLPPVLGGALLVTINLGGIFLIDFVTFFFAIGTLLCVRFPTTKTNNRDEVTKGSLLSEITYGWNYVSQRPGLLSLLIFFAASNFVIGVVSVLLTPLILSFTSPSILGIILGIDGIGMLISTVIITAWKRPIRNIPSMLAFQMLGGLCILVTGLRTSIPLIAVAAFLFAFGSPIINCSNQIIWQKKVPAEIQGRVFALERMIVTALQSLAYAIAGPLADKIFEPLMATNGFLANSIGQLIGVGNGRGIGLLFIIMGAISMLIPIVAYQYPRLRLVEDELLDQI